jgi:hypothetical protein
LAYMVAMIQVEHPTYNQFRDAKSVSEGDVC